MATHVAFSSIEFACENLATPALTVEGAVAGVRLTPHVALHDPVDCVGQAVLVHHLRERGKLADARGLDVVVAAIRAVEAVPAELGQGVEHAGPRHKLARGGLVVAQGVERGCDSCG